MERDSDSVAMDMTVTINNLLESSIKKLSMALADMFKEPDMNAEDSNDIYEVRDLCYQLASKANNMYEKRHPTVVPWLPEDSSALGNMILLKIKSPWSFVLAYSHTNKDPMEDFARECLIEFIGTPSSGTLLCVLHHEKLFRGLLLKMLSAQRLKVLNIDTNEIFIVPISSIYHMPEEVCSIHALSLHCALMEEDDIVAALWSEVEEIFTRALSGCSMQVEIVKKIQDFPPKYLVNLTGTNSKGHSVNLSKWLNDSLIPDLKQNYSLLLEKEEVLYFLKDESIDPFDVGMFESASTYNEKCFSLVNSTVEQSVQNERLSASVSCLRNSQVTKNGDMRCSDCLKNRDNISVSSNLALNGPLVLDQVVLPDVGDEVNVVISHILTPVSFYVFQKNRYSDEKEDDDTETYTTLLRLMNLPTYFTECSTFSKPPPAKEIVAFYRSSDRFWLRGVILETCSCSATLIDPDSGATATVPLSDLRKIAEEHKNIPFQAVFAHLHNLRCIDMFNAECRFQQLISYKKLKAIVKAASKSKCTIEIELFTSEGFSINEALVKSGFCGYIIPPMFST